MARRGSKPVIAAVGAVALAAACLTACGGGDGTSSGALPAAVTGQKPAWAACGAEVTKQSGASRYDCATLKVPLDYAEPDGEAIDLALIRLKATDQQHRIGSLLFNFGGPGGSGVEALAQQGQGFQTLGARYDLVSFDPRGVGGSAPVTCVDDRRMDQISAEDDTPDDAAEEKALAGSSKSYDLGCQSRAGRLLPYVGTLSAARDMDVMRSALGDRTLHYFGISYGTWLGGNYAHQMPRSVGRAVLDGAVDTKISSLDLALQQAAAFERALRNFGAACAKLAAAACPLGRDSAAVVASVDRLLDGLDAEPLPGAGGRRLTQSLGTTGVIAALYSEQYWPFLAQALTEAVQERDGGSLLTLADAQNGREEDGHYSNLAAAHTAITCADSTDRYTVQDVRDELPRFGRASPTFGASMAWDILECTGWPVAGDDDAKEVSAPDAPPIVVVGNTGDPATPYAWSPALAKEIGEDAVLVTLKGEGHGAYLTGDRCVRAAVDGYLLNGTVPAKGTSCG